MSDRKFEPFGDGSICEATEDCEEPASSECDGCGVLCCNNHSVWVGPDESYCPKCNPRVRCPRG